MKKNNVTVSIEELKRKDKLYLKELQLLFDKVDCIKDEELKSQILRQIHICEERIIQMCEKIIYKMKKS